MASTAKQKEFLIHLDGVAYQVTGPTISGAQLKALAGKDPIYQLFREGTANEPDHLVPDHEALTLADGLEFYTIPPAMAGQRWT